MKIHIYAMTHKSCDIPPNDMILPMQVGKALHPDLGYLGDDTGDNISDRNPYYSELTGHYWLWKNDHEDDIIGVCHYRRFLINDRGVLFSQKELEGLLQQVDMITTKQVQLNYTYYQAFGADHNRKDLDTVREVIAERFPEDLPLYDQAVNGTRTYFGNMFIMKKKDFDAYCSWLFEILLEAEKRTDMTGYNDYQKRLYGFVSELLLMVWVSRKHWKVLECKVAMLGEKKETAEMERQLAEYFRKQDVAGAKDYFLEKLKQRPDVLMEASDIHGNLKAAMEIIAIAEQEASLGKNTILSQGKEYGELLADVKMLNDVMARKQAGNSLSGDENFLENSGFSEVALEVARAISNSAQTVEKR